MLYFTSCHFICISDKNPVIQHQNVLLFTDHKKVRVPLRETLTIIGTTAKSILFPFVSNVYQEKQASTCKNRTGFPGYKIHDLHYP